MSEAPIIRELSSKIMTLERRRSFLQNRIDRGPDRSAEAVSFDKAEEAALSAAIKALRYHRAALHPETDPVLAIDELLSVIEAPDVVIVRDEEMQRFRQAVQRCKRVLEELGNEA